MNSTTDMAGHPDVAEISDLTEGLLPPSRTTDVRRHLDECELCADVFASLEEIRGLLGTMPGPPRMPDDVAGRIDAALAAEALLSATVTGGEGTPSLVTASRSPSDADESAHVSRETSATAGRPSGHARVSTTGPGRKDRNRAGRRRIAVLGTVAAVAALGFGSLLINTMNDGKPPGTEAGGSHTTAADTFSETKLEKQVSDLLAQNQGSKSGSSTPHSLGVEGGAGTASPKVFSEPTVTVPDCVQKGIGRTDQALATEQGVYQGKDALLVVLPDTSGGTRVTAYIVDATCASHPSSTEAKVLLTHSYTRH